MPIILYLSPICPAFIPTPLHSSRPINRPVFIPHQSLTIPLVSLRNPQPQNPNPSSFLAPPRNHTSFFRALFFLASQSLRHYDQDRIRAWFRQVVSRSLCAPHPFSRQNIDQVKSIIVKAQNSTSIMISPQIYLTVGSSAIQGHSAPYSHRNMNNESSIRYHPISTNSDAISISLIQLFSIARVLKFHIIAQLPLKVCLPQPPPCSPDATPASDAS